MITPIVALIIVLAIYVMLHTMGEMKNISYLPDVFIFFYFLFAFINIEGSATIATFYLFGILFIIAIKVAKNNYAVESSAINKIGNFKLAGRIPLLGIGLGVLLFIAIRILNNSVTGSIIGVPSLAIESAAFNVTTIMLLGIVETTLFLTIFNLVKDNSDIFFKIPVVGQAATFLSPIFPVLAVSILFAIFHLTAYSLSFSNMVFASLVMAMWVITYTITKSDLSPNISHAIWNGTVALSRALGVAI